MGKYAKSISPKADAKVGPDPAQHLLRDAPETGAAQGLRTTRSGVVGLREDLQENPQKEAKDKIDEKLQQQPGGQPREVAEAEATLARAKDRIKLAEIAAIADPKARTEAEKKYAAEKAEAAKKHQAEAVPADQASKK